MKLYCLTHQQDGFVTTFKPGGLMCDYKVVLLCDSRGDKLLVVGQECRSHREVLGLFLYRMGIKKYYNDDIAIRKDAKSLGYVILGGAHLGVRVSNEPYIFSVSGSFGKLSTEDTEEIHLRFETGFSN